LRKIAILGVGVVAVIVLLLISSFAQDGSEEEQVEIVPRQSKIPENAVKATPETDLFPPQLHSNEYAEPVPMPGPVNTAGAEDSPFITPDGSTFYFFFTPGGDVPVEEQITDEVTGIYVSRRIDGQWSEPERAILQDPGKLALDGCPFVQGDEMWFCSAREGYTGVRFLTADYIDGEWRNWEWVGDKLTFEYEVGELHISADGSELYFHSPRSGGKGEVDIWVSKKVDGEWQDPENIEAVNTAGMEGWPFSPKTAKSYGLLDSILVTPPSSGRRGLTVSGKNPNSSFRSSQQNQHLMMKVTFTSATISSRMGK